MNKKSHLKSVNVRMSHETWVYLKCASVKREVSINKLINECISKYQKIRDDLLTRHDAMVQCSMEKDNKSLNL